MNVASVMSRTIITIDPDESFRILWRSLFKHHVNALPVVNKHQKLVGIITKEDLLERLYPDYHEIFLEEIERVDFEEMEKKITELVGLTAQDVMSKKVLFTRADTPIMRALSRMITHRVNQLPVVDEKGVVVGMLTKGDIFYAMFRTHLDAEGETSVPLPRPSRAKK